MSAAAFRARYAAYSLDLAIIAPVGLALAWMPLADVLHAHRRLDAAVLAGMERAFVDGHVALLDLAKALRADAVLMAAVADAVAAMAASLALAAGLAWALMALYFVAFEASPWAATPGKRAMGLAVQSSHGGRAGIGRTTARFLAAGPSWLLLHLGHALVLFRDDGRAGHDLLAGTRVAGGEGALPPWARAWLAAQAAALVALFVAWAGLMARAVWLLGL